MEKNLTLKEKIGFGICDLGGNAFFTITAFWLMFYFTDIVGLNPFLTGMALLVGKIFDAVIDPFIGIISDRTRTKLGRRRPYILIGGICILITMIFLFKKPELQSQTALFLWAIIAYCLACLAFSLINIPYSSLTPELTTDYNERTSLNGFRGSFGIIGTVLAAIFFLPFIEKAPTKEIGYATAGIVYGFIIMLVSLITFFIIKEKPISEEKIEKKSFKEILGCFKNKPYILILIPWLLNITGITFITAIQQYYFKYVLNAEMFIPVSLIALLGTAIVFIPIWVKISEKTGKNIVYSIGLFIVAAAALLAFFFGHIVGVPGIFVILAFLGLGLSSTIIIPWSIVPDTIEYDYLKSKKRNEGIYYGIWTFIYTLGQAFAGAIMGPTLDKFGYVANAVQTDKAIFGIRLIYGPIPAFFLIIGAVIVIFYPITKIKYNEMMSEIKKM